MNNWAQTVGPISTGHEICFFWKLSRTTKRYRYPHPYCAPTLYIRQSLNHILYGPLTRYVTLWVRHALGMPGTFSPPPGVSDPDMHHGTSVTHVPCIMPGLLTIGFLLSRWREKRSRHSRRMCNQHFCNLNSTGLQRGWGVHPALGIMIFHCFPLRIKDGYSVNKLRMGTIYLRSDHYPPHPEISNKDFYFAVVCYTGGNSSGKLCSRRIKASSLKCIGVKRLTP